jgi:hypothetical protein
LRARRWNSSLRIGPRLAPLHCFSRRPRHQAIRSAIRFSCLQSLPPTGPEKEPAPSKSSRGPRQFQTTRHGRVRETAASGRIPAAIPSPNTLLFSKAASQSSSTAQAWTIFPPGCFAEPRGRDLPRGLYPVYSANSRFAAARGASPSPIRPFGIDHDPRSLLRQNGPPGWPSRTSIPPAVGR